MKSKRSKTKAKTTLANVCAALDRIAPPALAQSWDNVGLLAGDAARPVLRIMLCIDLTPQVATEAIRRKAELVVAYHPPIFKPIGRLTAQSRGPEAAVFRLIENGIAVYSTHTALDAADGGTNDVIAGLCGIKQTEPLEYVYDQASGEHKFVTFAAMKDVDRVAEALFAAGAGHIGDYSKCSYRLQGRGTFQGSDETNPTIGQAGQYETVEEVRVEMVCPADRIPAVTAALYEAHPYEEPPFDIYPLKSPPQHGIGRCGTLPRPTTLVSLARKLKKAIGAPCVQRVGQSDQPVTRAVIVVGAAGSMPFKIPLGEKDVIITGEIRHHDALRILRTGCSAIALNHWSSERPVLKPLADRIIDQLPRVNVLISEADCEPFAPI